MRSTLALLLAWLLSAGSLAAQGQKPIRVIIIGVPKNNVSTYSRSTLGTEFVKVCDSLESLFTNPSVEIVKLCKPENTTSDYIHPLLLRSFGGQQRGRMTIVFVMAHGEVTDNDDVRLLLSDASDPDKDEKSLLLKAQLIFPLANAKDSVNLAFVDACYSATVGDLRVAALGTGAEQEGTHAGVLVSSQPDEQALAASFTKALVNAWTNKTQCPHNPGELSSELLTQMQGSHSTPQWPIMFRDSLCLQDLLNPQKRVISVIRDPHYTDPVTISVFSENKTQASFAVSQGKEFANPYLSAQIPGPYRIEARGTDLRDRSKKDAVLDQDLCDLRSSKYCKYFFPPSARSSLDSLTVQGQIYRSAIAHGYSTDDLKKVFSGAAELYATLIHTDPTAARIQATGLRSSDLDLWEAMQTAPEFSTARLSLTAFAAIVPPELASSFSQYQKDNPGVSIAFGVGSGAGISQSSGKWDFTITGSSSRGNKDAWVPGTARQVPIAVTGVVPIYNVPGVTGDIALTPGILVDAFRAHITHWDDTLIAENNPGVTLPHIPIIVVHRTDSSDTSFIWSDYFSKVSEEWRTTVGTGTAVKWPVGTGAKGDEGMVAFVREAPGALGYVDLWYATENHLPFAAVRNASGNLIKASKETIAAAANATSPAAALSGTSITNSGAPGAYPIAGLVFIVLERHPDDLTKRAVVLDFTKWLVEGGENAVSSPYASLPSGIRKLTLAEITAEMHR